MTTDPKPLTREELLAIDNAGLDAVRGIARTVAALLPAEGAEDDGERQECESCVTIAPRSAMYVDDAFDGDSIEACTSLREKLDAAIARADAAEKRVAELEAECASISAEFDLPPTMRPVEGEIRRMRQATHDVADVANAYKHERDEARECIRVLEVERDQAHAAGIREGLERAAARVGDPNTRQTWLEPRFATALAKELRWMKRRVK